MKYKLTLISLNEGRDVPDKNLEVTFENHDDIFQIIEKVKAKEIFPDETSVISFSIGLKLFSEEVLKNRTLPLFEEFFPEISKFIKKLKSFKKK